ncbi:TetR/AcrR family transcriptional regulator [Stenotrophobium rhamnosiphilum]|uniref:HTH tetR-type domain-containing protein n=1 Tax=Stenotrophobium rhamnosiphilum TaxID=2029166 RepID=A0A2T5MJ11_9GAMM|nr:TetR/AcrR family transcriptional regulator [Stenotrophobium rhamnosiphilum]PTU32560.1 hypothetical protein CJD38_00050 [Stenotrophobium rhamnosiphilum]
MASSSAVIQRPRSLASEKAILKATLKILSESGYAGVTIDRVAAVAKASKSTIYRRWKTKEQLILAVISQLPIAEPPERSSLEAELLEQFAQVSRAMQNSPLKGVIPMLAAECASNPTLASALMVLNDRRRAPLRLILQRAIKRGEIDQAADIELTLDVIQGAVVTRMYFLLEPLTKVWIRKLVRLVTTGVGSKKGL